MIGALYALEAVRKSEKQNEGFKSIQAIYLTGTTNIVAKGELCDEELKI